MKTYVTFIYFSKEIIIQFFLTSLINLNIMRYKLTVAPSGVSVTGGTIATQSPVFSGGVLPNVATCVTGLGPRRALIAASWSNEHT